ncbi:MAG: type II toxin-antitoxin system HicA family toxin [Nitrospirota bacterium]
MGQRQPRVTADEIIRILKSIGFVKIDQSGSHQKWRHPSSGKQTIIPYHAGDIIRPKTLKRILEGAGLSIEDFIRISTKK